MFKSLHGKLSAVLLALLCLVGLFYIPLTVFTTRTYIKEVNQHLNRALASHLASHLGERNLLRDDPRAQEKALAEIKKLMVLNPDIEIYILDLAGAIVCYSAAPGKVQRRQVGLEPVQHFLAGVGPLPIMGDDPRHPSGHKVFSAARIPQKTDAPDRLRGYVYIILGGEEYESVARLLGKSYIMRFSTWSMIGSLLLVAGAGLLLFNVLTRPLRRLATDMEAFQRTVVPGHALLTDQAKDRAGDEIARLGLVFAQMQERIREQVEERAHADTLRRQLVSNVSHDLRTPLAALQGYLETLVIKQGQMSPEEAQGYLMTALKHSGRLGTLIGELFELARLDSHDVQVCSEPFSLSELVQDVVQEFQDAAQRKKLRLEANFEAELPFVYGAIGLIERTLENLISNAFRYTPEGGSITVSLALEADRVRVQVTDTGSGIGAADLPHIFDRCYQVEESGLETDPPGLKGAGLGLAITKRILELHHSDITVTSTVNAGTTFTFYLRTHQPRL